VKKIVKYTINLIRIFLILLILLNISFAQEKNLVGTKPISMQDSLNESMAHNQRIQSELLKFKAAKYRYEQATRRILPNISANTSYGMQRSKIGDLPYDDYPEKRYGITLTQDIYTSGRITAASEKARYDMLVALINIDIIKSEEALKFIRTYISLYGNLKTQNLMRKNINILKELVTITKTKAISGEANNIDVIQLEAELIMAQANLQKKIAEANGLSDVYKSLTGRALVPPLSSPLSMCLITDDKKAIMAIINQHNLEIKQAKDDINSKNQDVELSKANLYPTVSFSANARYFEGDSAFFRDEAQTSSAVIQVNIPIFDRGMEYSRIKEAKATKQAAEYDLTDIRNNILNKFENDYSVYQAQKLAIIANKKSVEAMNFLLKKTLREKDLGFKSAHDFLKIRQKVIDTKIDLINSKIENTFYGCKIIGMQGNLPIIIPKL
jgi:outer membrane protein